MKKHALKYPLSIDGKEIASVTIRRPVGRDMVLIGDHLATLGRYAADQAKSEADGGSDVIPSSAVFAAMVAIAACLADLGDAAGDLDLEDLSAITAQALNAGEALGRGDAANGGD